MNKVEDMKKMVEDIKKMFINYVDVELYKMGINRKWILYPNARKYFTTEKGEIILKHLYDNMPCDFKEKFENFSPSKNYDEKLENFIKWSALSIDIDYKEREKLFCQCQKCHGYGFIDNIDNKQCSRFLCEVLNEKICNACIPSGKDNITRVICNDCNGLGKFLRPNFLKAKEILDKK